MKNKKHHTVGTIPILDIKIENPHLQIYDPLLSWFVSHILLQYVTLHRHTNFILHCFIDQVRF